jgi:BlaI family transcriptional regulator, penicillinase repressor
MKSPMKELTKAEEQVMQILWDIEKGFVKDILEQLPEPKPAYNTVSTIVRILEKKEFVSYKVYGNSHQYYPLISKKEYTKTYLQGFLSGYFSNSYKQLVSFFSKEENLTIKEMEEIKAMIESQIEQQKQNPPE